MERTNTSKLAGEIDQWFTKQITNRQIWRTELGRVIQRRMRERGNWKVAPRGKPGWPAKHE